MATPNPKAADAHEETREPPDAAVAQEVAAWVGQWARTLKTCRLYDEANPTVVRFREELADSLTALLARRGPLRLEVSPNQLSCGGAAVHVGRSRDDNLAAVLHRDGIRLLAFEPGIEAREVDSLVDQFLRVTGPSAGDDDLVTLLWDSDLPHVLIETVPIEGEADGAGEDDADKAPSLAWPRQQEGATAPAGIDDESDAQRSDDWIAVERAADLEQAFDELESSALFEIARFQQEHAIGLEEGVLTGVLGILQDCFASELSESDREDLAGFIPRLLREALALGDWRSAGLALRLLRGCDPDWSVAEFARGLCGPFSLTTRHVVSSLDQQDAHGVESFLALARELGAPLAEWLMQVLAESQQMRVRRPLARAIGELLAGHPEPVLPWLSDPRWYVARNAVHILGWIGGDAIVGHLRSVADHPEPRVRREVVAALNSIDPEVSRPILMNMLKSSEGTVFGAILQQLAQDDHPEVAERLLELLRGNIGARSEEERRALFGALATRGDAVLPALEAELNQGGGLLSRRPEPDRPGIALCIARIGTPAANAVIERGLNSNRGPVRKACTIAGAFKDSHHD